MQLIKIPTSSARQPQATVVAAAAPRTAKVTAALTPDTKFFIPAGERRSHALYFYNNLQRNGKRRSEWVWASLITHALFPNTPQKPINRKLYKECESIWKVVYKMWGDGGASALISIKKDLAGKKFHVRVPLIMLPTDGYPEGMARLAIATNGSQFMSDPAWPTVRENIQAALVSKYFSADTLQAYGTVTQKDLDHLRAANGGIRVHNFGDQMIGAFLELEFTQRESEFLCNSNFLEIRPLDFYGVISAWVDGYFGMRMRSPAFSLPLGRIAKMSDANPSTPRTSKEGILLDEHGTILALPPKLNQISGYEEAASTAFTNPDGSFSALGEDFKLRTPPPAMPVYVDWVNLKFAYTTNDGKLVLKNLDRSQALNAGHARRFLDRNPATDDVVANFLSFTYRLGNFFNLPEAAGADVKTLLVALALEGKRGGYKDLGDMHLVNIVELAGSGVTEQQQTLKDFSSLAKKTKKFIEDNPANAYAKYSVPTIVELLGQLTIFVNFGPKFGEIVAEDNSRRAPYENQGEDPKWQLESVPFVEEKRGLMPHQYKVQNLLRETPDNAILPVDAGGGKTALIVYEIAKLMKAGSNDLFLVMCPAHLVAQYVKEFVYFTGAKINVIPVTNYTIRRHGLARLETMILNAPPNTVVVTDYNALVYRQMTLSYGVAPVKIFPIIDFLRKFNFQYCAADESHWLKNGSSRNAAAAKLFVEIKRKRLASGTMVADTLIDLVRQTALMDPSIFGTAEDFVKEFALEVRGTKVLEWKPGAELAVQRLLKKNLVIAGAKRKEWAAILPWPVEKFHPTNLTEKQFKVYQDILTSIREELARAAETNEALKNLLSGKEDPENPELSIDALLKPYLARLERFLNAPGLDVLGKEVLTGADLVSPKALKVVELCQDHLERGITGKILIFTNYENSAKAIYDAFPPDLKSKVIYYTAGAKEECGALFERDPNKMIMVGIENSMNTGLNLQFCSRLIRVETVWTPGVLEQGNSRIGRPNIKEDETRDEIYYDWILTNHTIDVTKISYLMAKSISKAKFDEAGTPAFDDLEVPPLFSMTLDTVFAMNDIDETLVEYFTKYEAYKQALHASYRLYREKNKTLLFDEKGKLRMHSLEKAANPTGSAVIRLLPYVPGTELYAAKDLGLVRYDAFMQLDEDDLQEEEGDSGEEDADLDRQDGDDEEVDPADAAKKAALEAERAKAIGLPIHTEFGDGEIIKLNARALKIRLPSGGEFWVRKMAAFVITRAATSGKDIRTQLLKMSGDLPLSAPIDVPETGIIKVKLKKAKPGKQQEAEEEEEELEDDRVELRLGFTIVNDFLGLRVENIENEAAVRVAQALGFKHVLPYYAAHIPRPRHLLELFKMWSNLGFTMDKENSRACQVAYAHFKQNVTTGTNFYGVASKNAINNFYRTEFKPNADKWHINPYPVFQDGALYLALPKNGQPGSVQAMMKARVAGVKWMVYEADSELVAFVPTKEKASRIIKTLLEQGVVIPNVKELAEQFKKLRITRDTTS